MKRVISILFLTLPISLIISANTVNKAHTAPTTPKNYVTFSEMIAEAPFLIAFPDGSRVLASHDLGIPLGAERAVLEPNLKERA